MSWIRNPNESFKGGSILWKAFIQDFLVMIDLLAWKVGTETQALIGMDCIMGCGQREKLSKTLICNLNDKGLIIVRMLQVVLVLAERHKVGKHMSFLISLGG